MPSKKKKDSARFFDRKTLTVYVLIILAASYFRFHDLPLRPVHHDEAVRASSLTLPLLEGKAWEYKPGFHGPLLMYATAAAFKLLGVNEFSLRVSEAFFGFILLFLLVPVRRHLGKRGFLFASALLALSPALVTYSRMAIQEPFLHFFELAMLLSAFFYAKTGRPLFACLAAASFALGVATKENVLVFAGLFAPYLAVTVILSLLKARRRDERTTTALRRNAVLLLRILWSRRSVFILALLIIALIHVTLFSYFGRNTENLGEVVVEPITYWQERVQRRHTKPWTYYIQVLGDSEYILVLFGMLGIAYSLMRKNDLGVLFSYWAIVSYLIYSFTIDFKEPWLITHTLLPLFPLAGIGVEYVVSDFERRRMRVAAAATYILLASAVAWYGSITYDRTFVSYAMESNRLTYVQALHDVERLAARVGNMSYERTGGADLDVVYAFDENYPLVWYFRDFPNVKYYKKPQSEVKGWNGTVWSGKASAFLSDGVSKSGRFSAVISSEAGADASWYQTVKAQGGGDYVFSGWVKTDGVQNINASKVAQVFIRGGKDSKVIAESAKTEGSTDWTHFELPFTLPSGDGSIKIGLSLGGWGHAKGTVWYDNLTLQGATLINGDFEEGGRRVYPSVYIISDDDEYNIDPAFKVMYERETYEIRPRVKVIAYFKKDGK